MTEVNNRISCIFWVEGIITDTVLVSASVSSSILCDSSVTFQCWRLYVIWLRNKYVMVLPIVILLGGLGSSRIHPGYFAAVRLKWNHISPTLIVSGITMFMYTIERMVQDSTVLIPVVDRWWEITLGFTITMNVVVPGLIIGRLWFVDYNVQLRHRNLYHVGILHAR